MLRKCRKCAICAVAVGTACTVCGEVAGALAEPTSSVMLYIAADAGADQPHDHSEPKAPTPTGTLTIQAATTAATTIQPLWGEIPASIATSTPLRWRSPPFF
jgi:hypothetical protein